MSIHLNQTSSSNTLTKVKAPSYQKNNDTTLALIFSYLSIKFNKIPLEAHLFLELTQQGFNFDQIRQLHPQSYEKLSTCFGEDFKGLLQATTLETQFLDLFNLAKNTSDALLAQVIFKQLLHDFNTPAPIREQSRQQLHLLTGEQVNTALFLHQTLKHLPDTVLEPAGILSLIPAAKAFQSGLLWTRQLFKNVPLHPAVIQGLATLVGITFEAPTATIAQRTILAMQGKETLSPLSHDLASFALMSTAFRITGFAANGMWQWAHDFNPQTMQMGRGLEWSALSQKMFVGTSQYSALLGSHYLETKINLKPAMHSSQLYLGAFASFAHLNFANHILHTLQGYRIPNFEISSRQSKITKFEFPELAWMKKLFPESDLAFALANGQNKHTTSMEAKGPARFYSVATGNGAALTKPQTLELRELFKNSSDRLIQALPDAPNLKIIFDHVVAQVNSEELAHLQDGAQSAFLDLKLVALILRHNPTQLFMPNHNKASDDDGFSALIHLFQEYFPEFYQMRKTFPKALVQGKVEDALKEFMATKQRLDRVWQQDWVQLYTEWRYHVEVALIGDFIRIHGKSLTLDPAEQNNNIAFLSRLLRLAPEQVAKYANDSKLFKLLQLNESARKQLQQHIQTRIQIIIFHMNVLQFVDDYPELFVGLRGRFPSKDNLVLWQWLNQTLDSMDLTSPDLCFKIGHQNPEETLPLTIETRRKAYSERLYLALYYRGHLAAYDISIPQALHFARENYAYYLPILRRLPRPEKIRLHDVQAIHLDHLLVARESTEEILSGNMLRITMEAVQAIRMGTLTTYPVDALRIVYFILSNLGSNTEFFARLQENFSEIFEVTIKDGVESQYANLANLAESRYPEIINTFFATAWNHRNWSQGFSLVTEIVYHFFSRTPELRATTVTSEHWDRLQFIFKTLVELPVELKKYLAYLNDLKFKVQRRTTLPDESLTLEIEQAHEAAIAKFSANLVNLKAHSLHTPEVMHEYLRLLQSIPSYLEALQEAVNHLESRVAAMFAAQDEQETQTKLTPEEVDRREKESQNLLEDLAFYRDYIMTPAYLETYRVKIQWWLDEISGNLGEYIHENYAQPELLLEAKRLFGIVEASIAKYEKRRHGTSPTGEDPIHALDISQTTYHWSTLSPIGKLATLLQHNFVFVKDSRGQYPGLDFLMDLDTIGQNKLLRTCLQVAQGVTLSGEKFNKINLVEGHNLYEVRDQVSGLRLFVALVGNRWFILNGYVKKSQNLLPQISKQAFALSAAAKIQARHRTIPLPIEILRNRCQQQFAQLESNYPQVIEPGHPQYTEYYQLKLKMDMASTLSLEDMIHIDYKTSELARKLHNAGMH